MNPERRAVLVLAGLLFSARRVLADGLPESTLSRIANARSNVHTLRGPFSQTRSLALFASDVRSTGEVALVRPDRLMWRLDPPDDVTFWVGPEGLAYRSAHGEGKLPSSGVRTEAALRDLRTLIGGDLRELEERWSLRVVRDAPSGAELEATARGGPSLAVTRMTFGLTADLTRPTRILLVEGPRDRTDIQFGTLRINEPIDPVVMKPP